MRLTIDLGTLLSQFGELSVIFQNNMEGALTVVILTIVLAYWYLNRK